MCNIYIYILEHIHIMVQICFFGANTSFWEDPKSKIRCCSVCNAPTLLGAYTHDVAYSIKNTYSSIFAIIIGTKTASSQYCWPSAQDDNMGVSGNGSYPPKITCWWRTMIFWQWKWYCPIFRHTLIVIDTPWFLVYPLHSACIFSLFTCLRSLEDDEEPKHAQATPWPLATWSRLLGEVIRLFSAINHDPWIDVPWS